MINVYTHVTLQEDAAYCCERMWKSVVHMEGKHRLWVLKSKGLAKKIFGLHVRASRRG